MQLAAKPRRKAEEIRLRLVEVACELFAAHGYDGVSVRDIAAAAGVQASVVIRYFGSKEALFRQVLTTSRPDGFEPEVLPQLPALVTEALLAPHTESHRRRSQVHQIFVRSLGSAEACRAIGADLDERYIQAMSRILPQEDAQARAGLVVSLVLGVRMMREIVQAPALGNDHRESLRPLLMAVLTQLLGTGPDVANAGSQN